jgi:hypothetical protein
MISPLKIAVTEELIHAAINQAKEQLFVDNLRNRSINVAFDSKIRGYIGELAVKLWFEEKGINFSTTNQLNRKSNMDVDFLYQGKSKAYEIELKTSLIPDQDRTIEEAICQRDIKLIRRGNDSIQQLKSDIHIQLFFKQRRAAKDEWLEKQPAIELKFSNELIYEQLACYRYITDTYLIGWIDKPALIEQIESKSTHRRTWKYGQREFWTCNLRSEIKPIQSLISYLKEA